ncbi:hypothetical protein B0H16DRAFT_1541111 [Mycena metata]|uniref:Uncharacterized protein n=1 Tax=Mycena metata TaxID=1033252 RepID=A0AAD7J1S5_9AGAR|nr:hypothetical protein B0H16DRAFT_1567108 [Mycena metata]KAJ7755116.1 hypothetical protein B0H16DRAFT_1541111 [Mycena metata]
MILSSAFRGARRRFVVFLKNLSAMAKAWIILVTALAVSLFQLRWIFWMSLYFSPCLPTISDVHQILLRVPDQFAFFTTLGDSAVIVAPIILHAVAMCLDTALFAFTILRAILRHRAGRNLKRSLYVGALFEVAQFTFGWTLIIAVPFALVFSILHFNSLPPDYAKAFWLSLFRTKTRHVSWLILQFMAEKYNDWKSKQLKDLAALVSDLQRAAIAVCRDTWSSLNLAQKALIILPIALYYAHLQTTPVSRKAWRIWWQRRRRLQ